MRYEVNIIFSGFYNSVHNDAIDNALRSLFSDSATGWQVNEDLVAYAEESMNWHEVFLDYVRNFVEDFAHEFKLDLEFSEMISPREFNFVTDRVFCTISEESLMRMYAETPREDLRAKVVERHTSRSGFISFYSNDLETWAQDPREWDCNEIGTLLRAFVGDDYDCWSEIDTMEPTFCNGVLDNILIKHGPNMERLLKIRDYLEARKERATV